MKSRAKLSTLYFIGGKRNKIMKYFSFEQRKVQINLNLLFCFLNHIALRKKSNFSLENGKD